MSGPKAQGARLFTSPRKLSQNRRQSNYQEERDDQTRCRKQSAPLITEDVLENQLAKAH